MTIAYIFTYQDKQLMYAQAIEMLQTDRVFREILIGLIGDCSSCQSLVVEFKPVTGSQMQCTQFEVSFTKAQYSDSNPLNISKLEQVLNQKKNELVIYYRSSISDTLIIPNYFYQDGVKYPGVVAFSCSAPNEQVHDFFKYLDVNILKTLQLDVSKKLWVSSNHVNRSLSSLVYMRIDTNPSNILHTPYKQALMKWH